MATVSMHNMFAVGSQFSRRWLALSFVILLSSCSSMSSPSPEELARIKNPPEEVREKLEILAPLTLQWYDEIEHQYLAKGRTLTADELSMAHTIGVARPEKVRVIILKDFPYPAHQALKMHTKNYGMGSSAESGRTMGNIIMLKAHRKDERWLLAYELAHIAQQEKMGRPAYVRRVITEYELVGRNRSPLELDAHKIAMEYQ